MHIEFGSRSDRGKVRDSNEDTCIINIRHKTFLVADGMGGHVAGEIASQIAASTIEEYLAEENLDSSPDEWLNLAVQQANTRVYETQMQKPEYRGMGSTLTILTFSDNRFHIAQVGDSRAYLLRQNTLKQLTRDHSVVWPLYENGILTKEDISRHPQKNLITRSIGTYPQVEVDLQSDAASEGDIFLLCSDGLTDVLTDRDISHTLSSRDKNPQELAEMLTDAANEAGGPDNITVIVVRLSLG
ncbi:MAG: Stp1/IreP family PP2C-type Ser/Thr phosphatase [Acidobacteria bacterium]|nr:Stp1/IreP family PP2C-type Ser/Thr phosphatase [Acidobacteriota bacterium]